MKVEYTTQEFVTSKGNKVIIKPTFRKFKLCFEYIGREDGNIYHSEINLPLEDISELITNLKKLEREYKSYKIVDDLIKETKKELSIK
jgi:hypothetical protein